MKIVADDNIPGLEAWCGSLGEIELVAGRELRREQLTNADVLLVRSVTPVNEALLSGTAVRFVGTATAGTDHVDLAYLASRGIHFAAAPGCNAVAVAEYVLACCLLYANEILQPLAAMTAGIIGCGHAGGAVRRLLSELGIRCVINDPPRALRDPAFASAPLHDVMRADIVTLHVPLDDAGPYPTRGMIGAAEIAAMAPRALLINAARGGVLSESAWLSAAGLTRRLALDCWQGEPRIDPVMRERCWIASPHIAGHTVDARLRATGMLARQLAAFLGAPPPTPPAAPPSIPLAWREGEGYAALVLACCNPHACTQALRAPSSLAPGTGFDQMRKRFGVRREFSAHVVTGIPPGHPQCSVVRALGFELAA